MGVRSMYSLGEVEAYLKGLDVKIAFTKSIAPLSVFKELSGGSFDYVECKRCANYWELPQSLVWLNLKVPASLGVGHELAFSVTVLKEGVYCLYIRIYEKLHNVETFQYYEKGVIEDVFKIVISTLQQYGDLDEIDKYVEIELKG